MPRRSESVLFGFERAMLTAVLAMTAGGCAASRAVEAARARDIPKLETALKAEEKTGDLDGGEARDVAHALARSEIRAAKGDLGVRLVRSLGECASAVEGDLDDRSEKGDDVAAAALGVMLDARLVSADEYAEFAMKNDARPMFRALGARSLVDDDYVKVRKGLFHDLDERVRLGALEAAFDFSSGDDLGMLIDAARGDPLPEARRAAIRAIGRIGGADATHALRDLWTSADTESRRAVAEAWASPKTNEAGGEAELVWAAEHDTGEPRITASLALAAVAPRDSDDWKTGIGVLTRAIKLGTRQERVEAMAAAPSAPPILEAVRTATGDSDPGVAIIAWSRLHTEGTDAEKKKAVEALMTIAKSDAPEASRAAEELAWMGDARVEPVLAKALEAKNPYARTVGARGLVALGKPGKAARLLGDKDADVRLQTACAILAKR